MTGWISDGCDPIQVRIYNRYPSFLLLVYRLRSFLSTSEHFAAIKTPNLLFVDVLQAQYLCVEVADRKGRDPVTLVSPRLVQALLCIRLSVPILWLLHVYF